MKRTAAVALVFALFTLASAFNHPEIRWKSVTTAHFIINYYDRTEPAVYATWKIAEATYESLSSLYEYEARSKINISLADYDDYANGFASWTNGSIMIWVTDIRFDLRGNNTWLNNVITHELAHIMTLEKKAKMQLFDWSFALGYSSPSDTLVLAEPFATTRLFPNWFTEGISQRETERRGSDCWDSRRDMLLKDAIINDRALTLQEMGHFNHDALGSEMVYNQGFSFVKYIEEKIGTPNLTRIFGSSRNNALVSDGFNSMFENQTGLSVAGLYGQWKDSLKAMYAQKIPPHPTKTSPVWNKGFLNAMPRVSPDRKWWGWLTNDNDDFSRTDLVIAPYGSSAPFMRLKRALSSWDFSADSRRVFFIKSYETSDNGSFFNDLYVADLNEKKQRRLTRGARIYDVAACPDNRRIACVQFRNGAFSIVTAGTDGCCWETLVQGEIGRPFAGLSFSPVKTIVPQPPVPANKDSAAAADSVVGKDTVVLSGAPQTTAERSSPAAEYMLATTRVINGKGTLCIVGCGRATLTMIGSGAAQEESPHWAADGRIYFDADYDGTFNIYSVKPDGSGLSRHTEAQFGMMSPFTDNNGKLLCVSYGNRAFSIVSCDAGAGSSYAPPKQNACSFTDLPRPKGEVTIKSRPYEAKLLRSVWELQSACEVSDRYGTFQDAVSKNRLGGWFDSTTITAVTGFAMSRADALDKKSLSFGAMAAVFHSGNKRDSAGSDTVAAGLVSVPYSTRSTEYALRLMGGKRLTAAEQTTQTVMRSEPLVRNFLKNAKLTNTTNAAAGDTVQPPEWVPVLDPFISYMNNENAISFGLKADVQLLYVIPYIFTIQGLSSWHIARDFYAALYPGIQLVPLSGFAIPDVYAALAMQYSTSGYMNTDIGYNMGGVTQLQLTIVPESFIPLDDTTTNLSSGARVSALTVQIDAMHAFPFRKYFSLELRTRESYSTFSQPVLDQFDLLSGGSTEYLSADVGASFVFPLWRQINGGPAYADALYGSVGYDVQMLSNTMTFQGDFSRALSVPSYDKDHIVVSHVFSAGVNFGFFKSYLFNRTLQAKAYWDVWKKKLAANISVGM